MVVRSDDEEEALVTLGDHAARRKDLVLHKFLLEEQIGVGTSAAVLRARMIRSNGSMLPAAPWTVAVKRFHDHHCADATFRARSLSRFKEGAVVSHPGIAEAFEIGETDGRLYLVTELVAGHALANRFEPRGVPLEGGPRRAVALAAGVADALGCAHARGVVHGFVHPTKIVVSAESDRPKLLGLASARPDGRVGSGPLYAEARYLSPEEITGRRIDARSDVFRLGTILWELLTGRTLVPDDSEVVAIEALRDWRGAAPRSLDPTLPTSVDRIVQRALEPAPDDRYEDGAAMARALAACS